ncbi:MAG: hypothetical protein E6G06_15705 [Actinobacteria bacterium]|nr:MAG: hypothetical protein E6G06_15705 [Actinomycetota bacterium]
MPVATWTPVPASVPRGNPALRRHLLVVVATVLLASVWPAAWALHQGDLSALVGPGAVGPSLGLLAREVPGLVVTPNAGHDGQQFYAIARKPFRPRETARYLKDPSYRYRRILFPLVGWALAPHGGRRLILAFAAIGLLSVGLSAAALGALPGARPWLPLVVAATPGVVVSLMLGLSDTLALALTLLAFAAAAHRRWALLVVALVLAALAKETAFLAAPALALTPGMPGRARLAAVAAPAIVLMGWVTSVNHALHASISTESQFGSPLSGWIHSTDTAPGLMVGLLLAITIAVGAWRARGAPHVRAYLVVLLALMAVLAPEITVSWINTSRSVIAGLPLAAWAISTRA